MKHLYRVALGCVFLGVFLLNSAYYLLNEAPQPWSGIVSMASWVLLWVFLADSGSNKLSEGDKLRAGLSMGLAASYLLYHIIYGPLPEDLLFLVLVLAIVFFSGAVCLGLWWAEVSPPHE